MHHTIMKTKLRTKVVSGEMEGRIKCSISWTSPLVADDEAEVGVLLRTKLSSLSAKLYIDQAFGAQYACERPRLNGNNRAKSWGIWPWKTILLTLKAT